MKANLSDASLWEADLSNANLLDAILKDAWLAQANLSGTRFSFGDGDYPAQGLTQSQIDAACSYGDNPPKFEGVLDAQSEEPLNPPTTEPGFWERITELTRAFKERQPESHREES